MKGKVHIEDFNAEKYAATARKSSDTALEVSFTSRAERLKQMKKNGEDYFVNITHIRVIEARHRIIELERARRFVEGTP